MLGSWISNPLVLENHSRAESEYESEEVPPTYLDKP